MELTGGLGIEETFRSIYAAIQSSHYFIRVFFDWFTSLLNPSTLSTLKLSNLRILFQTQDKIIAYLFAFYSQHHTLLKTLIIPFIVVMATEVLVDWLKHAFITKFNLIKPQVYRRFSESLYKDFAGRRDINGQFLPPIDQSPTISRRIGFVSTPLACLVIRVTHQMSQLLTLPTAFKSWYMSGGLLIILYCM